MRIVVWALFLIVLLAGICTAGTAVEPNSSSPILVWQKTFGGEGTDYGRDIRATSDGGSILVGYTQSDNNGDVGLNHGGWDIWVAKVDSTGALRWHKNIGGSGDEEAFGIQQTRDGGYILIGQTTSSGSGDVGDNHGGRDIWVVKLDSTGSIEWQNCFGGSGEDWGYSITQTTDGGYIFTGWTLSSNSGDVGQNHGGWDAWVVKLRPAGTIEWQRSLGGSGDEQPYGILQTSDRGYILISTTTSQDSGDVGRSYGANDIWVVKLHEDGRLAWQRSYGGSGEELPFSIQQTSDMGYIFTGITASSNSGEVGQNHGGRYDLWVVKLDSMNRIQWQKTLGGNSEDWGRSVRQTLDSGYILTGWTRSSNSGEVGVNHGDLDVWVVRLTATGELLWQRCLGGAGTDNGLAIYLTSEGSYILTGFTQSRNSGDIGPNHGDYDIWVVKVKETTSTVPGTSPPQPRAAPALRVVKSAAPSTVQGAGASTVTVMVENFGSAIAQQINVRDTVPSGLRIISGTSNTTLIELKPTETRTFQYSLQATIPGTYVLDPATVTYTDDKENSYSAASNVVTLVAESIPETTEAPGFTTTAALGGLCIILIYLSYKK